MPITNTETLAALQLVYPGKRITVSPEQDHNEYIVLHPFNSDAHLVVFISRTHASVLHNYGCDEFKSYSEEVLTRPIDTTADVLQAAAELVEHCRQAQRQIFDEGMRSLEGAYPPDLTAEAYLSNTEMLGPRELV